MHFRRLACVLLGVWLGGSALSALVIWQNRRSAEHLLVHPPPAALVFLKSAGREPAQEFLRYQAAESTRQYIETAEKLEMALALAVLLILLFGTHEGKLSILAALLMLAASLAQCFFITPEIAAHGRLLDFAGAGGGSSVRVRLHMLKGAWMAAEMGKLAVGLVLTGFLLTPPDGFRRPARGRCGL